MYVQYVCVYLNIRISGGFSTCSSNICELHQRHTHMFHRDPCLWRALWVRRASSHSYVCTFVYRPTADEKGDDSDAVLKTLEAVIDSKQCLHCANLCMPV